MWFKYLRIFYLNVLMIMFFYLNMPLLLVCLFLLKPCYLIWKLAFEQLHFLTINVDIDDEWLLYIDYDTDSNFYFKLLKGEYYLWYNCYFYFYFNGGSALINELDFLDIIAYKMFDLRNLKYSYKNISYKYYYNEADYFFLYKFEDLYKKKYNLRYNLKLINKDTYNILNNPDNLCKLSNRKKHYYIKIK